MVHNLIEFYDCAVIEKEQVTEAINEHISELVMELEEIKSFTEEIAIQAIKQVDVDEVTEAFYEHYFELKKVYQ